MELYDKSIIIKELEFKIDEQDYHNWYIGINLLNTVSAMIFAKFKNIENPIGFPCKYSDAKYVKEYFISKGMKGSDRFEKNAARGVFLFRDPKNLSHQKIQ